MKATFKVTVNGVERIMVVVGVSGPAHAKEIQSRIKGVHADTAKLISLEDEYVGVYTVGEVMYEKNLFGRPNWVDQDSRK